ncbi:MAG: cysteine hydrolase [Oscillibacter sp.]|nr:cysteine hydrolase [Oscillibacter sp.]
MEILVVVDMQNDFVSGALGTKEAVEIVPYVVGRVVDGLNRGETVLFTRDTHEENYMDTQEGKRLPVPHCIRGTEGWEIIGQLQEYTKTTQPIDKPTFGSVDLCEALRIVSQRLPIEKVTLIGLCTDICVISNALLIKAFMPEVEVAVDAKCCAGVTPQSHKNALEAMKMCQISVENA